MFMLNLLTVVSFYEIKKKKLSSSDNGHKAMIFLCLTLSFWVKVHGSCTHDHVMFINDLANNEHTHTWMDVNPWSLLPTVCPCADKATW